MDLGDVINRGGVLLVNLSVGRWGEQTSSLLGSFLFAKIWQEVRQRSHLPESARRDFLLYVDEFQQFLGVFRIHDRAGVRRRRDPHYLRGTVYCGSCGSRMSSLTAKRRYTYFYCIGGHTQRTDCDEPYIPVEDLESQLQSLHEDLQLDEDEAATIRSELLEGLDRFEKERQTSAEHLKTRLEELTRERDKLLRAYYADAITLDQLKLEQDRIGTELSQIERQIQITGSHVEAARRLVAAALNLATQLAAVYAEPDRRARQKLNQEVFDRVETTDKQVSGHQYAWPFDFMSKGHSRGSNKNRQVELRGFEPLTP